MGARQSKRSVDITTTPKKEGIPVEGGVVGDAAAPGDGKLERIEEADAKPTTNGIAPHTDTTEDKEDKDEATEKDKEQQPQQEEVKQQAEETKQESSGESPAEVAEVTTPTEATPASPNTVTTPDNKEAKKKDKKKKWSFRSISFSKKDKTKPSREEAPKNGDVTKEEPLAEGGEEAENATAATSSSEEKSAASSPSADEQVEVSVAVAEPKEESATAASPPTSASPIEEKKEEPTPSAPTPVPSVEDKKEETVEKVEAEKKVVVEVSQSAGGQSLTNPVEISIYRVQPVATPSIIERKTSEDLPSLPPSSPPPTPIDPSPFQQARQAAARAVALAEALNLPAVAADEEESTSSLDAFCDDVPQEIHESAVSVIAPTSFAPPADSFPTETTFVLAKVECSPVVEAKIEIETSRDDVAKKIEEPLTCEDKEVEIESKIESMPVNPVMMMKEVSKDQENEMNRVIKEIPSPLLVEVEESDTRKQLIEPIDSNMLRNKDAVEKKTEKYSLVFKEIDPFVDNSMRKSDSSNRCPINIINEKLSEVTVFSTMEKVSDIVATTEIINESLPIIEFQTKNEINNCKDDTEINVPSNIDDNEVEIETLPLIEIGMKQHLSSENFETEKIERSLSEITQHVKPSEKLLDLDLSSTDKYTAAESEVSSEEVVSILSAKIDITPRNGKEEPKQFSTDAEVDEERLCGRSIEYEHDYAKYVPEKERITSVTSPTELFLNSEEGPLSISEDILVEAKPAIIIPEDDSVEEFSDTTESIKVIPDTDEEKIENELESDTALPTEETLISEEDTTSVPEGITIEPLNEIINVSDDIKNEMKVIDVEDTLPSLPEDLRVSFDSRILEHRDVTMNETEHIINREDSIAISPSGIETETFVTSQIERTKEIETCPLSLKDCISRNEFCPSSLHSYSDYSSQILSSDVTFSNHNTQPEIISIESENVPISLDYPPPAPEDPEIKNLDFFDYSLLPEDISHSLPLYIHTDDEPVSVEHHAVNPTNPTKTLLTPPISPNFQSNVTSGIATETSTINNSSQIPSYDDIGNREQPESLSEPMILYDQSDIELKQRLAAECLAAKTESQEETLLSRELSNIVPSTASKEHHQKAPEVEAAPVENNIAHDNSMTESADEAPKIAPPAIPTEAPASPPIAPVITEDVASVTKAIEEIDISDKAVAAAVNEAIECNTNEIIADAHHQNNINE